MYTTIEKQYAEELIQNKRFLSPSFEVDRKRLIQGELK